MNNIFFNQQRGVLSDFNSKTTLNLVGIFRKSNQKRMYNGSLAITTSIEETQEPLIIEYCKEHNINLVETYPIIETGGTKANKKRKKFDEILTKVFNDPNIDGVITFNVSRFTRNYSDAGLAEKLTLSGGRGKKIFIFLDNDIILDKDRSDFIDMKQNFAKEVQKSVDTFYTAQKNQRITQETKIRQGKVFGNHKFGYKKNSDLTNPQNSIPDETNSRIVKKLFQLYATGQYSYKELERLISNEFGKSPNASKIEVILKDKFYYGVAITKIQNKIHEYPHIYERLITKDLYDIVQRVKLERSNFAHKKHKTLLEYKTYQGILKCGLPECNHSMSPDTKERKYKTINKVGKWGYYFCNGKSNKQQKLGIDQGRKLHERNSISHIEVENQIINLLSGLSLSEDIINQILPQLNTLGIDLNSKKEIQLQQLRANLNKYQNAKNKINESYFEESITKQEHDTYLKLNQVKLDDTQKQIEEVSKMDLIKLYQLNDVLRVLPKIPKLYEVANNFQKQKILNTLCSNLTVKDKKINFTLQNPFSKLLKIDGYTKKLVCQPR